MARTAKPKEPVVTGSKAITSHKAEVRAGRTEKYASRPTSLGEIPPEEVSETTQEDIDKLKRDALPQPPREIMNSESETDPGVAAKDTTIKIAPDLKDELGKLKTDPDEPYAGVIRRLITGQAPMESTQDVKIIAVPEKAYRLMMMILPETLKKSIREGVR